MASFAVVYHVMVGLKGRIQQEEFYKWVRSLDVSFNIWLSWYVMMFAGELELEEDCRHT